MGNTSLASTETDVRALAARYPSIPMASKMVTAQEPATMAQGEVPRFLVRHSSPPNVGSAIKRRMNNVGTCMDNGIIFPPRPYYVYHPAEMFRSSQIFYHFADYNPEPN